MESLSEAKKLEFVPIIHYKILLLPKIWRLSLTFYNLCQPPKVV